MYADVKKIRKCLTEIELEAGNKHPEPVDYRVIQRELEEIAFVVKHMQRDVKDLRGDIL